MENEHVNKRECEAAGAEIGLGGRISQQPEARKLKAATLPPVFVISLALLTPPPLPPRVWARKALLPEASNTPLSRKVDVLLSLSFYASRCFPPTHQKQQKLAERDIGAVGSRLRDASRLLLVAVRVNRTGPVMSPFPPAPPRRWSQICASTQLAGFNSCLSIKVAKRT